MAKKQKVSPPERIRGFTSIDDRGSDGQEGKVVVRELDGYSLRRIWHNGEWWHSVVDVVGALAESKNASTYWRVTKKRLADEGSEVVTKCNALGLPTAGGAQKTDCATTETIFRIIESVPSKRAEPIKQYLAMAGAERLEETANPSKAVDRAIARYREMGREDEWIDHRLQNISARNELTDEWNKRDVPSGKFGELTNEMSAIAMGAQPVAHAELKGVKPTVLREHMNKSELAITTVGETAAKAIIVHRDTKEFDATKQASLDGAHVARAARKALEEQLGRPVASKDNFLPKPDGSDTPLFAPPKPAKPRKR